uniref:S41 family peptidase n=1 Tax=Roseihalotalea indica TaxID=2867963 RepID=A0AA49GS51_9BACT|nr:S41 family peptidase [Tunicatimonas sp. TK19036]
MDLLKKRASVTYLANRIVLCIGCWALIFYACQAQSAENEWNFDFEKKGNQELPAQCINLGTEGYTVQQDSSTAYSGDYSVVMYPQENAGEQSIGIISHPFSANYAGENITLEGYMKLEDVEDGFAGLLMRIDSEAGPLAFNNVEEENIHGTQDWKKYTVTLSLPKDATRIYVAGILSGTGKAWFDNFSVTIDGTDIRELKPVEKPKALAAQDTEFDEGSDIQLADLSDLQTENLYLLGKVWGYVKYNHPEIALGNVNWDYELLRVLPKITNASSEEAAQQAMVDWIQQLGPLAETSEPNTSIEKVKLQPDTGWISSDALVHYPLQNQLNALARVDKPKQHYYLGFAPGVGNPIFQHEKAYSGMSFSDDGFTLLSLFRYWNMIEYFFPNRHLMDEDWDAVLRDFIPKMVSVEDELSYKLTLLELIGKVQDTHANIWQRDAVLEEFWGGNIVPVELKMAEDQVVISKVFPGFDGVDALQIGDIITEVNGQPVDSLITEKSVYAPASNRPTQLRDVLRRLLRTNEDSLTLTLQGKGAQVVASVPASSVNFWKNDTPSHTLLEDSIGYIYPGSLARGEIDTIMADFMNTQGLIIDLRCYPSDFIVFSLSKYLMPQPTPFVSFTHGSIEAPGLFTFTDPLMVGEEREDYYQGDVVILINETTQSQAEYTTMALRVAPNATVVGSTTAGADGNVSEIILPGNIRTMISGIGVYYPDGEETQRVGIVPDIALTPTIEGIREGKDELLEKAKEVIDS